MSSLIPFQENGLPDSSLKGIVAQFRDSNGEEYCRLYLNVFLQNVFLHTLKILNLCELITCHYISSQLKNNSFS